MKRRFHFGRVGEASLGGNQDRLETKFSGVWRGFILYIKVNVKIVNGSKKDCMEFHAD